MRLRLTEGLIQELMREKSTSAAEANHAMAPPQSVSRGIAEPLLGNIFQQYQQHEHFNLAVVQAQPEEDIELTTESMSTGVNMNFMLSGSIYTRFSQLPHDIHLTQARHNLLYINNTNGYHIFQKGQLFQNLHISLSEAYFKELCPPTSQASEKLHTHMLKQQPVLASQNHGTITLQMSQAIQQVLNCGFRGAMQKLYMEAKVLELLALQLNQFELQESATTGTFSAEKALAEELRQYLHLHYLDLPSLKELARGFGTNEFKIKKVFREHIGSGIFAYAQQLRLHHAKDMLLDGKLTVAEVADLIGYSHANHFSNAFKKHFGHSPSSIK